MSVTMVASAKIVRGGKKSMNRVRQAIYLRDDRWVEPWKENSFLVPLPCRRTSSVISEFLPLKPFRSRSAVHAPPTPPSPKAASRHHPTMQRGNHVGVARFYDWSEEKEESVSVSRLYREIAGGGSTSNPKPAAEKVRPRPPPAAGNNGSVPWPASIGRGWLNPGRMFLRDKGMLTKGEREIVEGIYRNRGDLRREGYKSEFYVKSHHDAWVVGKPGAQANKPSTEVPREPPRGGLMEVTAPPNQGGDTPRGSGGGGGGAGANAASQAAHRNTCIMCMREQQLLQQLQQQKEQQQQKPNKPQPHNKANTRAADSHKHRGEGEGRTAPPSTPDRGLSPREGPANAPTASVCPAKLLPRRQEANATEIPPQANGSPQAFSPSYESDSSDGESRGSSSRRKVHVKVVLPQVAPWSDLGQNDLDMPQDDHDFKTCMLQKRPTLARERHLTHSDLRAKPKQKRTAGVVHGEHTPRSSVQDDERVEADEKKEEITSPRKCLLHTHHITLLAPDLNGGEKE